MGHSHIFFTLRAIWNSLCAKEDRIGQDPNLWSFSPTKYPRSYLKRAVREIIHECRSRGRDPFKPWQLHELDTMAEKLRKNPDLLDKPIEQITKQEN